MQMEGKPKCCFFKFSSKIQYNKVVKAQLWIYLRPVQKPTTVFVQILRLIKPMKDGTKYTGIRSLKLDMNPGTGIWQSIDVKTVLQNWLKQPESNLGIEIKAFDENGRDLAVTFPGPGEDGLVSSIVKDSHRVFFIIVLLNCLEKLERLNFKLYFKQEREATSGHLNRGIGGKNTNPIFPVL